MQNTNTLILLAGFEVVLQNSKICPIGRRKICTIAGEIPRPKLCHWASIAHKLIVSPTLSFCCCFIKIALVTLQSNTYRIMKTLKKIHNHCKRFRWQNSTWFDSYLLSPLTELYMILQLYIISIDRTLHDSTVIYYLHWQNSTWFYSYLLCPYSFDGTDPSDIASPALISCSCISYVGNQCMNVCGTCQLSR